MIDDAVAENILRAHKALTESEHADTHGDHVRLHAEAKAAFMSEISQLKFPADAKKIASLSLEWMQWWWITSHNVGVAAADTKDFERFWFWHYLLPTRVKRISLYLLKPYLLLKRIRARDSKAQEDLLKRIKDRNKERSKVL